MKQHTIPANTGPDSLWRQAERAAAGAPPLSEKIASEIIEEFDPEQRLSPATRARILVEWAGIIERALRKATGVR